MSRRIQDHSSKQNKHFVILVVTTSSVLMTCLEWFNWAVCYCEFSNYQNTM